MKKQKFRRVPYSKSPIRGAPKSVFEILKFGRNLENLEEIWSMKNNLEETLGYEKKNWRKIWKSFAKFFPNFPKFGNRWLPSPTVSTMYCA
jgi:hypothetical protein